MRSLLMSSVLALTCLAGAQVSVRAAWAQAPSAPAPEPGDAVRAQEEAFRRAELNYDQAAAKTILADEFVIVGNHGEHLSRQQFIDLIGDKADPLEILEYGDMQVRVYGDTATVFSTVHERAIYGGKPEESRGLRTSVWVKRNGRWQCVLIHTSASEEKKS